MHLVANRDLSGQLTAAPQAHATLVADDAVQPAANGRRLPQVVKSPQCDQKCVLHRILGLESITKNGERGRGEPRPVTFEQGAKRGDITRFCRTYQFHVTNHGGLPVRRMRQRDKKFELLPPLAHLFFSDAAHEGARMKEVEMDIQLDGAVDELARFDGIGQAELVRRRDITPIELVEAAIARIERLNPLLNAVVTFEFERALDAERRGPPAGPFMGVPYLLKDLAIE